MTFPASSLWCIIDKCFVRISTEAREIIWSLADMYCMRMITSKMQGHKKLGMQKDQDRESGEVLGHQLVHHEMLMSQAEFQDTRGSNFPQKCCGLIRYTVRITRGLQAKIKHVNVSGEDCIPRSFHMLIWNKRK
uniref:Uncharacterized protein n=1 Tax=Aegilops tauschii TaxID=37682 RepID=M8BCC9_AEGTA